MQVITDMVINDMSIEKVSIKYDMPRSTIKRRYEKAVVEIDEMYQELTLKVTG